jgi:hypothetical protein
MRFILVLALEFPYRALGRDEARPRAIAERLGQRKHGKNSAQRSIRIPPGLRMLHCPGVTDSDIEITDFDIKVSAVANRNCADKLL